MNKNLLMHLVVFLMTLSISNAQEAIRLTGSIRAGSTKLPIEGATVVLKQTGDSLFRRTSKSDRSGAFTFPGLREGRYFVTISHLGFRAVKSGLIQLNAYYREITLPAIDLEEKEAINLKEVVIVSEPPFIEQQLDRIVLNVNSIISNAGSNAIDVLNNAPGVLVDDNGGISLRGIEGVTILVDDKPTHLSGPDLVNYLKSLPEGALDKIEIMANPPARYHASGAGGIINIKTRKIREPGINGHVSVGFGRGRLSKSTNNAGFSYKRGKAHYSVNAGYSLIGNFYEVSRIRRYKNETDGVSYKLVQENSETNSKRSTSYRFGVDYDIGNRTSFGILINGFSSPYAEGGKYENQFTGSGRTIDSIVYAGSDLRNHSANNAVSAVLTNRIRPGNELNLSFDYLNYDVESVQVSQSDSYLADGSFKERYILTSNSAYSANIYGSALDYSNTIFGNWTLETGLQAILSFRDNIDDYYNKEGDRDVRNTGLSNAFKFRENIHAGYINTRKAFDRVSVQAGLRVENTVGDASSLGAVSIPSKLKLNYTDLFPTVHLSYRLSKDPSELLNFSAGRRISRPNYQDLNPSMFFFDRNTSNRGNPLLTPGYSLSFDLSYNQGSRFSAGLLYNRTRDKIVSVYRQINEAFVLTSANIDQAVIFGLRANRSFTIGQWLSSNLYGELINASYNGLIFNDEHLENSMTTFNLSGQNQIKFNQEWSAAVGGQIRGRRIPAQGIYRPIGQLNMSIQRKIMNGNGTITLGARDIFHTWVVRRAMSIRNVNVVSSNTNDTRQVNISMNYRFGKAVKSRALKSGIGTEAGRAGV